MNINGLASAGLGILTSLIISGAAHAGVLDTWTTNQITTNSFGLSHIVYGDGRFVAVGDYGDAGAIFSSEDGTNWVLRYTDLNSWGLSLSYSVSNFACVGLWESAISTNGTNWTVNNIQSLNLDHGDIVYGGSTPVTGVYALVGGTNGVGYIAISGDGVTWTPRAATTMGGDIYSVAYANQGFVAVGNNDGNEYTSLTGNVWTRRSVPGGNLVSAAHGLVLLPVATNQILFSINGGVNWAQHDTGLTNELGKIIYAHGLYLANAGMHLATSTDGTNWYQYASTLPGWPWITNYTSFFSTDGNQLVALGFTNYPGFPYLTMNGFIYDSGPLVGICTTNHPVYSLTLSGLVGRNYQIQSIDALGAGNSWRTNTSLQLTTTPQAWTDPTPTNSTRFYRGVLLP